MTERETILSRLRQALAQAPWPQDVLEGRTPQADGPLAFADAPWDRVRAEWRDLGLGAAWAVDVDQARAAVADVVRENKVATVICWAHPDLAALNLDGLWAELGVTVVGPEPGTRFVDLADRADLGLTAVDALVVETGTLVVLSGPGRARSASLLPPRHLALVTPGTLILPDILSLGPWLASLSCTPEDMPSAVQCITGPSATADIELITVKGVHGPVALDVVVLDRATPDRVALDMATLGMAVGQGS